MTRYLINRILQAIPVLFLISMAVYGLILISPIDPVGLYEENLDITMEDMAMLEYRLGLRQPAFLNFRGSKGTVKAAQIDLYNQPGSLRGMEPSRTGKLSNGVRVAIIDAEENDSGSWVKVLQLEERMTGWTLRDNLSVRLNLLDSRYFKWLFAVLQGDFGRSIVEGRPALEMIVERFPNTVFLMSVAFVGQLLIAIPIGILSAIKQYSVFDHFFTILAYMGRSIPTFWFGLILIIIFHANLDWPSWAGDWAGKPLFPGAGMIDLRLERRLGYTPWWDYLHHLALPVAMLSVHGAARYMRFMRASMLETIYQDYIRTARAKGLKERVILYGHALKNAAIPLVTIVALRMPALFGGSLFTETIFSWPGMGRLFFRSAQRVDYAVLMGIVMVNATLILAFNLVADFVYAFLDPRIRYD